MSLWKKILLIIAGILAVLALVFSIIYKFIIVPRYIEPVLHTVAVMMNDTDLQETLTDVAADLVDKGVLDEKTFKNYLNTSSKISKKDDLNTNKSSSQNPTKIVSDNEDNDEEIETQNNIIASSKSSVGIVSVNSIDDSTGNAKVNQKYSQRFSTEYSDEDADIYDGKEKNKEETDMSKVIDSTEAGSESFLLNGKENSKAAALYNKIVKAMSLHERSVFFNVMTKADTDKLIGFYRSSNKSDAKKYLQSILDSGEYNEAVEIFFKYAPLLVE